MGCIYYSEIPGKGLVKIVNLLDFLNTRNVCEIFLVKLKFNFIF